MIRNKNQLKIKLREDKESLIFETIMNKHKPNLVKYSTDKCFYTFNY